MDLAVIPGKPLTFIPASWRITVSVIETEISRFRTEDVNVACRVFNVRDAGRFDMRK